MIGCPCWTSVGPSLLHMMDNVSLSWFSSVENTLFKKNGILSVSPFIAGYIDWTGLPKMVDKAIMVKLTYEHCQ